MQLISPELGVTDLTTGVPGLNEDGEEVVFAACSYHSLEKIHSRVQLRYEEEFFLQGPRKGKSSTSFRPFGKFPLILSNSFSRFWQFLKKGHRRLSRSVTGGFKRRSLAKGLSVQIVVQSSRRKIWMPS